MMSPEEWLRRVGFTRGNPFANKQADEEDALQRYFVDHPVYEILRTTELSKSVVLAAPRGFGKSTARRMFEEYCSDHRMQLRPLLVRLMDWSWAVAAHREARLDLGCYIEELLRQIVGALGASHNLPWVSWSLDPDSAGYLRWLVSSHGRYLRPLQRRQLLAHLSALDNSNLEEYNLASLPPAESLELVSTSVRALGFETVYILVDRIDELAETSFDAELGAYLLAPLLGNLVLVETRGIVVRCFVPKEIMDVLTEQGQIRPDRLRVLQLSWEDSDGQQLLLELLSSRLAYYSDARITRLAALADLDLRDLDEQMVDSAANSPRQLLNLGELLIQACATDTRDDTDDLLITAGHLRAARERLRDSLTPQVARRDSPPPRPVAAPAPAQVRRPVHQGAGAPLPTTPPAARAQVPQLRLQKDGTIWRGEQLIEGWNDLPEKQRRLLEYLYERRGTICRKEEIIAAVWHDEPLNDESGLRKLAQRLIGFVEQDKHKAVYIRKIRGGHFVLEHAE